MNRRGAREFHVKDDEVLQLLMADNNDEEDALLLDEEDQQFITQDVENGITIVEIENAARETQRDTSATNLLLWDAGNHTTARTNRFYTDDINNQ
ncbi:uncharacterized protein LOC129731048 isoform X7 [Wyeomyia smithii]|uniref:uncharacterized protein LOC129731048 isoform X7 n=1 Tax=Wyeomyia smithii TaxID=174621 RepID=UPI002467F68E|nr:uncharacterized protein LOC129731048 isoform X7 [Wyeomyia smithii]